jgi:two-component system, cell cycle sensor histidine kinase and response regulator CckA
MSSPPNRSQELVERDLSAFDDLLEGVQILGRDWRYLYVNETAARHGRRTRGELLGHSMLDHYPGIEKTDVFQAMQHCMAARLPVRCENRFAYPDGTLAWFELHIQAVPEGIRVMSIDVTQRRQLEEQFQAAQRLDSVGRLAAGIAHDLNNVLTIISTYSTFLLEDLPGDSQASRDVEQIRLAARRSASLVAQLLAFTRRQAVTPIAMDVNQVIRQLDKQILERLLPKNITVQLDLSRSLDPALMDPMQVDQVLMNLILNARDAMMSAGGQLRIKTENACIDDHSVAGLAAGAYVVITVRDTGEGMTPDVRAHAFEPFFTTKGTNGTGLGLSTVYGIVKQHGGAVAVESEPGRGTTFRVYLPRAEPTGEALPAHDASPRGGEWVLLAEDEAAVREAAATVLRQNGYVVCEATDVDVAARLWQEREGAFDLIVTDLALPGGSGRDLVARLSASAPPPPVLYLSGYAEDLGTGTSLPTPGPSLIPKPFTPTLLLERVRAMLAPASAG